MDILIIEDEVKTARSLISLINSIRPDARIAGQLQSVAGAIDYLSREKSPDLIFMDIQLSDGRCFEIFKSVKPSCPVIFCTAFDEYMMQAFQSNGIDYVLKPFSKEKIAAAFDKLNSLKNFFQQNNQPNIEDILKKIESPGGKKSFLVFKNNKYITVATEGIAFFFVKFEAVFIVGFDGQEYPVSQSLDHIHQQLSDKQFFRLNRQYLINFQAVKEVEHYFARKLLVKLVVPTAEKLIVSKEKVTTFLEWLENR